MPATISATEELHLLVSLRAKTAALEQILRQTKIMDNKKAHSLLSNIGTIIDRRIEEIEDALDLADSDRALAEAAEKGTILWETLRANLLAER